MTANPITDQILAKLHSTRAALYDTRPTPQAFLETFDLFAERIADSLPGIRRDHIGQVLLHAGELYSSLATNNGTTPIPVDALAAVRMLTEAGQRLYDPKGGAR